MKKKISKKIKNKIVSESDIKQIFKYLYSEYSEIVSTSKTFSITLYSNDSEVYEIQDSLIDDEIGLLNIKRIRKICVYISDYRIGKKVSLELCQDSDYLTNKLIVESDDVIWVNNQYVKINELIDSWKPQNAFFSKYKDLLMHFFSINIGLLSIKILMNLLNFFGYKSDNANLNKDIWAFLIDKIFKNYPFAEYIILILFSWLIGLFITMFFWIGIEERLIKLWPSIEFDFGPEHLKYSKNKRKVLWFIFTLIILPILLQILIPLN